MSMNYYIHGNAANADKIRAAFERLGYNTAVNGWNFNGDCGVYFTNESDKTIDFTHIEVFVNLIKTHPDYKELPVEPKFKVGDWVVFNNSHNSIYLISEIRDSYYMLTHTHGGSMPLSFSQGKLIRPWTIEDAKDGDILTDGKLIVIFNKLEEPAYKQHIIAYVGLDLCGRLQITEDTWRLGVDKAMPATKEQCDLLFAKMRESGYQWDADKKELSKIIEPNFKVGDWIVQNDNGTVSQITKIINGKDEYGEYRAYEHTNGYFHTCFENEYHLWTIADAKPGDVLMCESGWTCIFKNLDLFNEMFSSYCFMTTCLDFMPLSSECHTLDSRINGKLTPATEKQHKLFFKKMKEAGYTWDVDKKELHKIKHYDIGNFYVGMPVLVRDNKEQEWRYTTFSHISRLPLKFAAGCTYWCQCVPFEGNEHLLGTTKPCDEKFINW